MELSQATALIRNDHIAQYHKAVTWADLGCGTGLFTRALASLLPRGSTVYAADRSITITTTGLQANGVYIEPAVLDFVTGDMSFGALDGILMANSLHFAADKPALLKKLSNSLKEDGCLIIAEYDTDTANPWVPYPVSLKSIQPLFKNAGFTQVEKLRTQPSIYGRADIYTVLIRRQATGL
jgi:SAM-dependent methyltransferase